jgi:hypothetical protein
MVCISIDAANPIFASAHRFFEQSASKIDSSCIKTDADRLTLWRRDFDPMAPVEICLMGTGGGPA